LKVGSQRSTASAIAFAMAEEEGERIGVTTMLQSARVVMALSAGTRLGPYEIQAAIGAGGMGEVYKARDTRLDRSVAIKILPPDVSADPERNLAAGGS